MMQNAIYSAGRNCRKVALDMVTSLIVGALASTAAAGTSAAAKVSVTTGLVGLGSGLGKGAFAALPFGGWHAPFHCVPAFGGSNGAFVSLSASASGPGATASAFASVPTAYANVPAWGLGHGLGYGWYGWHAPSCIPSTWGPWTGFW